MSRAGPVVLMYHDVDSRGGVYCLSTSRFREHVDLVDGGKRAAAKASDLRADADDAVAVTFDDGAKGVVENALPLLSGAGLPATLFMTASLVGQPGWCSADDLRAWCSAGNELGSHGWVHESLTRMPETRALEDLRRSKTILEDIVGQEVTSLSFPNGRLRSSLVRAAKNLGLVAVFGSWPGRGAGRSGALGRYAILDRTSDTTLERLLEGRGGIAYAPQRAMFVLGRLIGESAYVRLHRLLEVPGRPR